MFVVKLSEGGFALTEVASDPPVVKAHDFLAEFQSDERPWEDAWVATVDGQPVAVATTFLQAWNRRMVLWGLYVDKSHRGHGIGRALVDVALEHARAQGARQLWLETQNTNMPAVRAYRRLGFSMVGLDQTLYDGQVAHETALYFARDV